MYVYLFSYIDTLVNYIIIVQDGKLIEVMMHMLVDGSKNSDGIYADNMWIAPSL